MNDNGQWIMMAVKCIGKQCINCPYLEVDTVVCDISDVEHGKQYVVDLHCRSMNRCIRIKKMMEEENNAVDETTL